MLANMSLSVAQLYFITTAQIGIGLIQKKFNLTLYTRKTTIVVMNIGTVNYYSRHGQLRAISALYLAA